jgi:alpha 1,2-mannosyltransferase
MTPAIVYLAQNTTHDPQYGRDSRSLLEQSLDLLFQNYNDKFQHDVLIFHEGDFTERHQRQIAKGRSAIKFHEVHFELPTFLSAEDVPEVINGYRVGYRHMIRFFAVQLFDIMQDLRYDWFMRMDDDSFLHSTIRYNLFEFMEKNGYEYGYRVDVRGWEGNAMGFGDAALAYLAAENQIVPTFFGEHLSYAPLKVQLKNLIKVLLMRLGSRRPRRISPAIEYDHWGYYNNFFITKIAFWKRPDVQAFMRHFDRIGGWYKYRWGDANFQSVALQIFLEKNKVYKFTDWTYEHATIVNGQLGWGGIYQGANDPDTTAVTNFRKLYGKTVMTEGRSY